MSEYSFTFRGETLEDHGYMICEFDGNSSANTVTTDSQRSFTSISMYSGKRKPILFYTYEDALVIKFSICKVEDANEQTIEPSEAAAIKRWLSSPTPQELRFSEEKYNGYHWVGVFNIEEVHYPGGCIGFDLTFTSLAPFAYKEKVEVSGTAIAGGSVTINDTSDEEGYIYPDVSITLRSAGDLRITNSFDNRVTVINGCSNGETITLSNLLQISSSNHSHILGNDFNYRFLRINNDYDNNVNKITFSLPCSYVISYKPIAKVVFA